MMKCVGGFLGAVMVVLACAVPAAAATTQLNYEAVGSLDYIWTGVPTRGCAAAGMCGVTGSLQVTPDDSSGSGSGPPSVDVSDQSAVVRVEYPAAAGAPERVCADPMPYDVNFALARGRRVTVGESEPNNDVSAGQCAGPTADDLDSARLPVRREPGGDYDLAGAISFGAGPFAVTVISKLRVLVTRQGAGELGLPPGVRSPRPTPFPKPRRVLAEEADVSYRIAHISGTIVDSFTGLPTPLCDPLAACGTTGSVHTALSRIAQTLQFSGQQIVKHRISRARALADLLAGRLELSDNSYTLDPIGTLTGSLLGPGSARCLDTITSGFLGFASNPTRTGDELALDPNGFEDVVSGADPLRTRCPGPGANTIIGAGAVASGSVRSSELDSRRIRLVLTNPGRFTGIAYTGTRAGAIVLSLVRTKVTAGTVRARAIEGQLL
jgi:hypothetical protein